VVKNGTEIVTLSGNNTYSGITHIEEGTLKIGSTDAIGNSSAVLLKDVASAKLDLDDNTLTIGSLASVGTNGSVVLGSNVSTILDIGSDDTSTIFKGVISGAGSLYKKGTGNLTLSGDNTYSNKTYIENGAIAAESNTAFGTSSLIFIGGTLKQTSDTLITINNNISASGYTGLIDVSSVANGSGLALTGILSDSHLNEGFTKKGAGNLYIESASAHNTYAGTTTIEEGELVASGYGFNPLNGNGDIKIESGSSFGVRGTSDFTTQPGNTLSIKTCSLL